MEEYLLDKAYNQQVGETYDDWKYRLILGKRDGNVSLSWAEICTLLNLSCSSEHIRKIALGVAEYRDFLKEKNQNSLSEVPQSSIDAIDDKRFELQRQKMQMQDQKRELNKKLREWARADHIQQEIVKAIKNLKPLAPHKCHCHTGEEISTNEGVLLLSDWHVGQFTMNFNNSFNDVILEARVRQLEDKVIEYGKLHNVCRMHVFALGDFINGLIHVTTRINNTENVIQQCMHASELLCDVISTLSENFEDVSVYFARGNHDRVSANMKESVTAESFFDIIQWYLAARLEGIENVHFIENTVDSEIATATICGQKIFAVHGHKDKPAKAVQNLSLMLHEIPDYVFMGHFHSAAEREVQGAEIIVNSSLCGTDDYAVSIRKYSKPAQKFMIFNDGGRLCTYNIQLGNGKTLAA